MGEFLSIRTRDGGEMPCYVAMPEKDKANGHGIVVAMTIAGVTPEMRDMTDCYASLGYASIVPNLFWRIGKPGQMEFNDATGGASQAKILLQSFDDPAGVQDLGAAADHLRGGLAVGAKIGSVGWCMGGRLAYLSGADPKGIDAGAGLYPTWLETCLDVKDQVRRPMSIHMPEHEPFAKLPDALNMVVNGLKDQPNVELFVYPGAAHSFDNWGTKSFDRAASRLANMRIARFFDRVLK